MIIPNRFLPCRDAGTGCYFIFYLLFVIYIPSDFYHQPIPIDAGLFIFLFRFFHIPYRYFALATALATAVRCANQIT
jgi:hypothetical protein